MDKDNFLLKFAYGDHSNGQEYPLAQLRTGGNSNAEHISLIRYSDANTTIYSSALISDDGTFVPNLFRYREYTSTSATTSSQGRGIATVTVSPPTYYVFFGIRDIYFYSSGNYNSTYNHFSVQSWNINGNSISIRTVHDQGTGSVAFKVVVSVIFLQSRLLTV